VITSTIASARQRKWLRLELEGPHAYYFRAGTVFRNEQTDTYHRVMRRLKKRTDEGRYVVYVYPGVS
jgi:hypothetical protein